MTTVSLRKYHGLGNDFLVALEPAGLPGGAEVDAAFAIWICDRHRGVGADGLIVARPSSCADVRMELRNADGGRAETSGNGLRCLALAMHDAGIVAGGHAVVETDAGLRRVRVEAPEPGQPSAVSTEMGVVRLGGAVPAPPSLGPSWAGRAVEAGNPHLVLLGPSLDGVDIAEIGPALEKARPGGQNVEAASPVADGLALVVWERGAGLTEACGSGSCAVAAVARAAELVGDRVTVHNPGGAVVVQLSGDDVLAPFAELSGPVQRIAHIDVDPSDAGGRP